MRFYYWLLVALVTTLLLIVTACEVDDDNEDVAVEPDDDPVVEVTDDDPTPTPEADPTPTPQAAETPTPNTAVQGEMVIHYIDVGQADATLIDAPDANILIDVGHWQRDDVVPYLQGAGIDELDLIIGTHPHADHIGQVPQVIESFSVHEVWFSGWEHDTATFERAVDAALDSDAGYHEPRAGETESFGDVIVEVVHPAEPLEGMHDGVAARVSFGDVSFLFTGDAETEHEQEILDRAEPVEATIYQLGHHGSSTSSTEAFLQAVNPEIGIYSAGEDNEYGHPHAEVVERFETTGIDLYGTDVRGTIIVTTDGTDYEITPERDGTVDVSEPVPSPTPQAEPDTDTEPVGVSFVEIVGGPPGSTASATVETNPSADCTISYTTPAGNDSQAAGLESTSADENGIATWEWSIGPGTNPGEGSVQVTCNGESASESIVIE